MRLMHYAEAPVEFDRARPYEQRELSTYVKPVGFWVSVAGEADWPSWCRDEDFGLDRLAVEHEVTLAADANVLVLDDLAALRSFHERFAVETERVYGDARVSGDVWAGVPEVFPGTRAALDAL